MQKRPSSLGFAPSVMFLVGFFAVALLFGRADASEPQSERSHRAGRRFEVSYMRWNSFYKRSLLATSREAEGTKRWLAESRELWYALLYRFFDSPPAEFADDPHWRDDLASITGYLHLAEWHAYAGDFSAAHDSLEPVRYIWMRMRERNEVAWFGDEVTHYHDVMEPLVQWGMGNARGGVTPENVAQFEEKIEELFAAWQRLGEFRYRRGNWRRLHAVKQHHREALDALQAAVSARQYQTIPDASREVRATFIGLFMGFG